MAIAAIRYNNPGNVSLPIQGWNGGGTIVGIPGQKGYASFPDMQTGFAAFQARLSNYIDGKGYSTIAQLNSVYAQDPGWGRAVSGFSGIGLNEPLDTSNSAQMSALQSGIIRQETGMTPDALGIDTGGGTAASDYSQDNTQDQATWNDPSAWGGAQTSGDFPGTTNFDSSSNAPDAGMPSGTEGFGQAGAGVSGAPLGIPDTPNIGSGGFGSMPMGLAGFGGGSVGDIGSGPNTGSLNPVSGSDTGEGVKVDVTDVTSAGSKAGEAVQKGLGAAGQDVKQSGAALDSTIKDTSTHAEQTGTGWLQYAGNLAYDFLPRVGVGLVAVAAIVLGFWFIGKQQKAPT